MAVISCKNKAIATNGELEVSVKRNKKGKVQVYGNFPISINVYCGVEKMLKKGVSLASIAAAVIRDEYLTINEKHGSFARTYGSHMTTSDGVILN